MYETLIKFANAANACYDDKVSPIFQNSTDTCHVYYSVIDDVPTFAFEGTSDVAEWLVDLDAFDVDTHDFATLGPVHRGFYIDTQEALAFLKQYFFDNNITKFNLTGHSKGASEALLMYAMLKLTGFVAAQTIVFEPARVGGNTFANYIKYDNVLFTRTQTTRKTDLVTIMPWGPNWVDAGRCINLDVSDSFDMIGMHKMPGVFDGLTRLKQLEGTTK